MDTSIPAELPVDLDLTDSGHLDTVLRLAEAFEADATAADAIEAELLSRRAEVPLIAHLAAKLARSRAVVADLSGPVFVSVVFAVYKEHNRILSRDAHPHGENFLLRKLAQLRWLFEARPDIGWELVVVDDGCPEGSGRIAARIAAEQAPDAPVRVLHLEAAIAAEEDIVRPLTSTNQSRKGGSIQYGMWTAAQAERDGHVVVFTDADLSTHLGQVGLLLDGIVNRGKAAAIGSRREDTSVVVKKGVRNTRGKLFIYLWKRLLPQLNAIVDTQCGFKAFRADVIRAIVPGTLERGFAFDVELLLRTVLGRSADAIEKVGVAWIDSEAASTTTDLQPYLSMLKAIAGFYRHYLPANPGSDAFAALIEGLDEARWQELVAAVPEAIASRNPAEFGTFDAVTAADIAG